MNDSPRPARLAARKKNRHALLAIALMVFGTFVVAGALRFSGWRPVGMKNKGELLDPPGDLRRAGPRLAGGGVYHWRPAERHWRILVAAPENCGAPCDTLAVDLDKVWQLAGRDAERIEVFWLGEVPASAPAASHQRAFADAPAIRDALPGARGAAAPLTYVIDPNGFAILRYRAGQDPGDLRGDLAKLLKLK
ncbi:hypothetical protein EBB59_11175 [Lysobacter pythonis]|uniref:Thioredoxin domain-containing protein n=1 Tax=Solilutibacter pythonis TaxID=2483112 RepID=A0A3M2HQ36_9GAMM|nr:hypothetical protein [Lysobacter pythonis]RMH89022.1 hypothetical protein EBB59_11175 [Lysobacter pythonis]